MFCISQGISAIANASKAKPTVTNQPSCAAKATNPECFVAGTLILTKEGNKPIEDIKVGDLVWAYNEETGESDWKEVVQLFRNESELRTTLSIDCEDKPIECTPEHPFYILNTTTDTPIVMFEGRDEGNFEGQWVAAKDLKKGDKCLLSDGKTAIITKTGTKHLSEPITTYNFEVQDFHTYYVGEQGILVHNVCPKYRGYNNGQSQKTYASNRHVDKIDDLVQSTRGASVNTNPLHETMNVFDHVDEIVSMSDDLMYVPKPSPGNLGHFEIVPKTPMSMSKFNKLLGDIQYRPFR